MNKIIIPEIDLKEYDYDLPKEFIALYPLPERDGSKLLFTDIKNNKIEHYRFRDLAKIMPDKSLLILNETKVIQARMMFKKPTGGAVELLLVEPVSPSTVPATALEAKKNCVWECIIGGKRVREGMRLSSDLLKDGLTAKVIERMQNSGIIEFTWEEEKTFSEIIREAGAVPLPPYIARRSENIDKERYQTVFAAQDGSIAAPTAGLHFSDNVFNDLKSGNVDIEKIVLHVGPGTFVPVSDDNISKHEMHYERIEITKNTIEKLIAALDGNRDIIAVGTTCCRTLETLYWHGLKLMNNKDYSANIDVEQWEPYQEIQDVNPTDALTAILDFMDKNKMTKLSGRTQLFIVPGYDFKIINGLITNFHLPKSTLILLVAAFTGKNLWKNMYETAKKNNYRFLSYGDSAFLLKSKA